MDDAVILTVMQIYMHRPILPLMDSLVRGKNVHEKKGKVVA